MYQIFDNFLSVQFVSSQTFKDYCKNKNITFHFLFNCKAQVLHAIYILFSKHIVCFYKNIFAFAFYKCQYSFNLYNHSLWVGLHLPKNIFWSPYPGTCECELILKWSLCRYNQIKIKSHRRSMGLKSNNAGVLIKINHVICFWTTIKYNSHVCANS